MSALSRLDQKGRKKHRKNQLCRVVWSALEARLRVGFGAGLRAGLGAGLVLITGACRTVPEAPPTTLLRPAYGTLEELFQTEVVNIGLERLGYEVLSGSEVEYDIIHEAIAKNYLDYTTVHWHPLHNNFYEENGGEESLVRTGTLVRDAVQGYLIDSETARKFSVNSLEQLKNPAIAALFDSDGDGKANLVGCPTGWGCRDVIEHHLTAYGLRETVEHDSDNYFALIDGVFQAYNAGEPVLYYTWTPLWVSNVLTPGQQVEWLEVPYTALPEGYTQDTETMVEGKNLGFAVNQIEILANREFLDNNPLAANFFEAVEIPIEAISVQNQRMRDGENTPSDVRAHAEAWVSENQALFDSWIEAAQ